MEFYCVSSIIFFNTFYIISENHDRFLFNFHTLLYHEGHIGRISPQQLKYFEPMHLLTDKVLGAAFLCADRYYYQGENVQAIPGNHVLKHLH